MQGFFKTERTKKRTARKQGQPRQRKKTVISGDPCEVCGLYKGCKSPRMEYSGKGRLKIFILAEAPGKQEDEQGIQLVGRTGQAFRKILNNIGIDLDRDCWKLNAINCRPPDNRTPALKEIECCFPKIKKTIEQLKPDKIITLGKPALQSILCGRETDSVKIDKIGKWVGWKIPDQDWQCWVFPTWHPSYINREKDSILERIFKGHLKTAIDHSIPFQKYTVEDAKSDVICLIEPNKILRHLERLNKKEPEFITIDYETTGLKPHADNHKIVCMSISETENRAIAFPLIDDSIPHLQNILTNIHIRKSAHNIKFEDTWTRYCLSRGLWEIEGWDFDSMIAAHVLDNRQEICRLKFQTYVRYGIIGYDESIEPYIQSVEAKNSNSLNRIREAPLDDLLIYCGLDSLFGRKLAIDQKYEMEKDENLLRAYNLFHTGMLALSDVESNGICISEDYHIKQSKHLGRRIERLAKKIQESNDVKLWKKETGSNKFNPNSPVQLSKLLFEIKGLKSIKKTPTGRDCVDEEVMESLKSKVPFVDNIVQKKKLEKIKTTYIEGFLRESVNGIMRPNFNLHTVRTYRSSSSNPNFQNIPVRDEEAEKITRSGIIPRPGNQIAEIDYAGIEVRVAACYTEDKVLIEYINDSTTDIHRDQAMRLFKLEERQVTKDLRYYAKNQFVFPEFYGDYYKTCATNIWKSTEEKKTADDILVREHMKNEGIGTYKQFEKHVKAEEERFWRKYSGYAKWKDRWIAQYRKDGFIEMLTGFRCDGPLSDNQLLNTPIQGVAFHLLLWSLIELNRKFKDFGFQSKIIGQIHDSIVLDIYPPEWKTITLLIRKTMTIDIRKHWPWIIVPLDIEAELTPVDGNWYQKKVVEI